MRIIFVFNCEDGQTLVQAVQRGCGDPKQSAFGDPALGKGVEWSDFHRSLSASLILGSSGWFPLCLILHLPHLPSKLLVPSVQLRPKAQHPVSLQSSSSTEELRPSVGQVWEEPNENSRSGVSMSLVKARYHEGANRDWCFGSGFSIIITWDNHGLPEALPYEDGEG